MLTSLHAMCCTIKGRRLQVHVFTLRNEDRYQPWDFGQDVRNAFDLYLSQQVDGMFTDFPESLARHLDDVYEEDKNVNAAQRTMHTLYGTFVVVAVSVVVIFRSFIHRQE